MDIQKSPYNLIQVNQHIYLFVMYIYFCKIYKEIKDLLHQESSGIESAPF
jgi:hypothetical protein